MNQPLRVLHFQGRMGKGGAETFMMNTYRNIDREKIQFDFLIYDDFVDVTPYHEEIKTLGGNVYVVPNPKKNIIAYIRAVKKLLNEKHFDIAHNEVFFGGGLNLWLAHRAGIEKRIAHSHATTDGKSNNIVLQLARKVLDRMMFKYATDFLACSTEAGVGLFGEEQTFIFVPNGIDLDLYRYPKETSEQVKDRLQLNSDSFVIGNIGRFEEQKNHHFLIDIFEEVKKMNSKAHLLLIGEGTLEEKIKQQVKRKGLERAVTFLGVRDDIPKILKALDVFLMPSLYEGLPISAVEAQAAGVKLILSEEVSKETKLSENVRFLPLDLDKKIWAKEVLTEPYGNFPLPIMEKYDMHHTAQLMEKVYFGQEIN